jgi:SEC-C motif-containing protein
MRSRYTAHAVGDEPYLHRTYAQTARKPYVAPRKPAPRTEWVRLVIHSDEPGPTPDIAFVEFSAFYRDRAGEHEMRERSEFRRVNDQWLYTRAV